MTADLDHRTRVVLSWLREDAHEDAERVLLRVLDEVDTTPQRRSWWPAWRTSRMSTYAKLIVAAAAVLVVAVVGSQFLPRSGGTGGQPSIAPSSSPALLARGTFVAKGAETQLDATGADDGVRGTMGVAHDGMSFTVDLKCGRTADDGRILIAGDTTESTSNFATTGTRTAIALKPGSPVVAAFEFEDPAAKAESCLAFLDAIMDRPNLATLGPDALEPIQGTVQLAP